MAVISGENALSEKTIETLFSYIEDTKKSFVWGSNLLSWSPGLTITNGVVLTHKLPADMTNSVFAELAERGKLIYRPKNGVISFYIWFPGSCITWHTDYRKSDSMTVYLTKDWNPNHGGYFCWRDWDEALPRHTFDVPPDECRMRLPKYNHYVNITDSEWHSVTITAPCAPPRLSLQMFFEKPIVAAARALAAKHGVAFAEPLSPSQD